MFCFKCGASMPDTSTVCPQCATPVQTPPVSPQPASVPNPASTSALLNPQSAPNMQQPQPYYGQQQSPSAQQTDGKATASLVLGILSLLCFSVLAGIPAIILGHMSKANIRRSMGRLKGEGMATAGLVMGYISAAAIPFILIVAAIAIPNLLRAKISANESAAASTVRTINVAQVTYSTTFPDHGYSIDLTSLGPGSSSTCSGGGTPEHACLLDEFLGGPNCTSAQWCGKNGYQFSVSANCKNGNTECTEYVISAKPIVYNSTGIRAFCSTSDAVVRYSRIQITAPVTPEECSGWTPI